MREDCPRGLPEIGARVIWLVEGIGIGILIVVSGRPADMLVVMDAVSCKHAWVIHALSGHVGQMLVTCGADGSCWILQDTGRNSVSVCMAFV